jgi:hypothetical protein
MNPKTTKFWLNAELSEAERNEITGPYLWLPDLPSRKQSKITYKTT